MMQLISADEVSMALEQMLQSHVFKRARRMCRLLKYLIEQTLHGTRRDVSEYAIGLEVFDRDPKTYYPGEDPVVRVQVGRLRERLKEYYASIEDHPAVYFSIPVGNYRPLIQRLEKPQSQQRQDMKALISVLPLQYGAQDIPGRSFVQGVTEELCFQLYQKFGSQMISASALDDLVSGNMPGHDVNRLNGVTWLLEGSIRIDDGYIKSGVRLIDARSHTIVWSHQFLQQGKIGLLLQEQVARGLCEAVQQYMQLEQAQAV
jgi:TolB-like protein